MKAYTGNAKKPSHHFWQEGFYRVFVWVRICTLHNIRATNATMHSFQPSRFNTSIVLARYHTVMISSTCQRPSVYLFRHHTLILQPIMLLVEHQSAEPPSAQLPRTPPLSHARPESSPAPQPPFRDKEKWHKR